MFQESPFSGVCAYAVWEVTLMLVGTLLLGLLLGYLIWGWTRRKLLQAEEQIASMTKANLELEKQLSALRTVITDQQQEIDQLKDANDNLNKRYYALNQENANLKKERDEIAGTPEEDKSELAKLQSLISSNESLISTLYTQLTEAQSRTSKVEKMLKERNVVESAKDKATSDVKAAPIPASASPHIRSQNFAESTSIERDVEEEALPSAESLAQASEIFGKEITFNDLTVIEGIGPRIEEVLRRSGIASWSKLSDTTRHILRVVLDEAGGKFRGHKPKTWPRQARMAANGEWKKLKAYQDILIGGK